MGLRFIADTFVDEIFDRKSYNLLLFKSNKYCISCLRHIATPAVAEIPMLIVNELEVRKRKLLLQQF